MADQEDQDDGGKGAPASIEEQQLKETLDTEERVEEQKLERIADPLSAEERPPSIEEQRLKETPDTEEMILQDFVEANQEWLDTMPYPLYSEERTIASVEFVEGTLESLIQRNDWLQVDKYLKMIVNYNFLGSTPAIIGVAFGEINKEHPELALLPRRQHIHDVFVEGKYDEASEYYKNNLSILEECGSERVHAALSHIYTRITNRTAALENAYDTGIAIKDYIYLYFPLLRPEMEKNKYAGERNLLWEFAWPVGSGLRCLACHKNFPNGYIGLIGLHLKGGAKRKIKGCPAVTKNILERLQITEQKIAEQKQKAQSRGSGDSTHEHPLPDREDGGGDDSAGAGPSSALQVLD